MKFNKIKSVAVAVLMIVKLSGCEVIKSVADTITVVSDTSTTASAATTTTAKTTSAPAEI